MTEPRNAETKKKTIYNRVLLKLGGEALAGPGGFGIDPLRAEEVAQKVQEVRDLGVEIAIVIGATTIKQMVKSSLSRLNKN